MNVLDEPVALLCAACERPIRAGARFCSACGRTHEGPPPADAPAALDAASAAEAAHARVSLGAVVVAQWSELTRLAWLYGLWLLTSLIFSWVGRFEDSPWVGVGFAILDAVLVLGFVVARPAEVLELLRVPRVSAATALRIAAASVACVVVLVAYFVAIEQAGIPMLELTDEHTSVGWPAWSSFALISVMPAVFEELGFRGVIQCTLERVFSAREAQIIQAALFSIVHLSPVIFASHFLMGFYFGWLRNRTRSLYPSMLAHGLWNAYWVAEELFWS